MTTFIPQQSVMMNPTIPLHAQLQYQNMQSQSPAFHYRPQLRMPQPALTPSPGEVGFDVKMLRKAMARKTVDYNSSVLKYLESRKFAKNSLLREKLQPDILFSPHIVPPLGMLDNPVNSVTTKFIRPATNKNRCPIFCVCWTPDGRRLITGASSGEFTLWNGLTFNFETILQAHESSIRAMIWSHNENWMLTGDQSGFIKYWQSNMNNVKMFQAHKEPVRGLSFCPTDAKFATCSDDSSIRIIDFIRCKEECALRGHGSEVKCVDWHPHKGIVISGSKDSQQPIILWDPRGGKKITTLRAHKNACTDLQWNRLNGNWLISASRDNLCKLFDIRCLKKEIQCFRGHKKEASSVSWHPIHENLFASGGADGGMYFWLVGSESELAAMENAHDGMIWDLSWHPLGHMLVSGSNDHTTRFWTRNRPGDTLIEKSNEEVVEPPKFHVFSDDKVDADIPGLGNDESLLTTIRQKRTEDLKYENKMGEVSESLSAAARDEELRRKRQLTFTKPISRVFEKAWNGYDLRAPLNVNLNRPHSLPVHNPAPQNSTEWRPPQFGVRLPNNQDANSNKYSPESPVHINTSHMSEMLHESPRSQWEPQSPVESNHFHQEGNTISESDNFFGAFRKRSPSSDRPSLVSHIPRKTPSPTWRRDSVINTPPTDRHSWSQQTTWQPTDSRITRESRWHDEKRPRIADYYERRPRQQFEHSRR